MDVTSVLNSLFSSFYSRLKENFDSRFVNLKNERGLNLVFEIGNVKSSKILKNSTAITANILVPKDHWIFCCHFKHDPVVPGSFLFETILKTICIAKEIQIKNYRLEEFKLKKQIMKPDNVAIYGITIEVLDDYPNKGTATAIGKIHLEGLIIAELKDLEFDTQEDAKRFWIKKIYSRFRTPEL